MIVKIVHDRTGCTIVIDNTGQEQRKVKVTGDEPIRTVIDDFLNKDIQVRYKEQITSLRQVLSEACIMKGVGGVYEIYKASDLYLTEYFIPKFCSLHGYTVATDEFKG